MRLFQHITKEEILRVLGKMGIALLPLLLLCLPLLFRGLGASKLPNGMGEEIFTDLASGKERIQEWSEDIHSELLTLDLGSVQEVRCFRVKWDRSACSAITHWTIVAWQEEMAKIYPEKKSGEGSMVLYDSDQAPYLEEETICLDVNVPVRTLRIIVQGADTAPEISVYAQDPWEQVFATLNPQFEDGRLVTEKMPSWLAVNYAGCRPSALLDAEGYLQRPLEAKQVHVGFTAEYKGWTMESPDYVLQAEPDAGDAEVISEVNPKPAVIPELQEWKGAAGEIAVSEHTVILADPELKAQARFLAADVEELTGWKWEIRTEGTPDEGWVVLKKSEKETLGEEGYEICLDDTIELTAYDKKGIFWGGRTLLQMLLLYAPEELEAAPALAGSRWVSIQIVTHRIPAEEIVLPQGTIRDYPSYPVRGFEIDVARNSVSIHMLREMVKTLSWYKCNELTVHLNDNAILAYTEKRDSWDTVFDIYSAFRLESGLTGKDGNGLTATDLYYSKEEFATLVQAAASYGVRIIPEIDTPAHSLAITEVFPECGIASKNQADMLDLSKEESVQLVKDIWNDAMPALEDCPVVHIGADEYYGGALDYITFENGLLEYLAGCGKCMRMWGSLSKIRGNAFVTPREDLELLIWNTDWADPRTMYQEGFALINAWNRELYLILGGGNDYLDGEQLYSAFRPNRFHTEDESETIELPAYSDQIRGAQLCMWNDLCDELAIGITEYDMFDRLYQALPAYASKCWNTDGDMTYAAVSDSAEQIGVAPRSDPYDQFSRYNDDNLLGPPYRITLKLERIENEDRIDPDWDGIMKLGDQERDGNPYIFYLRNANGKVGIACEEYEAEWDYEVPVGQKVELTIEGNKDTISLYADGKLIGTLGSSEPFTDHRTFLFPMARLHSAFNPLRDAWPPCLVYSSGEMLEISDMQVE